MKQVKEVGGVTVVKQELAPLTFKNVPGEQRVTDHALLLTLENGRQVYACGEDGCDRIADHVQGIISYHWPHTHGDGTSGRGPGRPKAIRLGEFADMTLEDLLDKAAETGNQEWWRKRLEAARSTSENWRQMYLAEVRDKKEILKALKGLKGLLDKDHS